MYYIKQCDGGACVRLCVFKKEHTRMYAFSTERRNYHLVTICNMSSLEGYLKHADIKHTGI